MISNRTRAARLFDFEITRMISDQIALHSVQLPLLIKVSTAIVISNKCIALYCIVPGVNFVTVIFFLQ